MRLPSGILIQTIFKCNASCLMCPMKDVRGIFDETQMTMDLYRKIIDDLVEYNYNGQVGLYLHMEPLLDNLLFDRIILTKEKLPKVFMLISTNAGLLTDYNCKQIADLGLETCINITSIEKELYEKLHSPLKFDKVIENIKRLRKYTSNVWINFVLSKENIHQREEVKKFFSNMGINRIEMYGVSSRANNVREGLERPNGIDTRFRVGHECRQLDINLCIVSNGDIIRCCMDWRREYIYGNALRDNIINIWNKIPQDYNSCRLCKKCKEDLG